MAKRIVILGGGFAGVKCARVLAGKLDRASHEVVIFNRENHMVFHPMLAEVAGGSLNPDAVAAPLRQLLPRVWCRTEEVLGVDIEARLIRYRAHDEREATLSYDELVVACGSDVNLGVMPGMADHAFPLKTVGDAVALRAQVMQQLEKAEVCDDEATRRWYLSFIVVGGGYSGVEAAGEINDLARSSRRFFKNIRAEDISVHIIHSRDQLLPEIGEKLRQFTRDRMERAGIDVVLEARVAMATARGVVLQDGRTIEGGTIVCTIGTAPSAVVQHMAVAKDRGRLLTQADMRVQDQDDIWAIGDCAIVINELDGKPSPPTGQFAERQGKQAALNILRKQRGEPTRPFRFKPVGQLCAIGGHKAVAEILGLRISGFVAWFLWRTIYLMKLPSWSRRIKAGFDWGWQIFFSRDLSHLKADTTSRVSRAYYRAGDLIFAQGDPATDFYVLEKGEVDVLRRDASGAETKLARLGPGDFFGEMALLTNNPRNADVRAATDVEVVVMGRNVFSRISESMAPLKEVLVKAMRERAD
ncbi:MAG: FAD-dependent oxidoreductase [Planctomycetes bacterium]|nr:FAD-dependent oxidoreductase [Planctomycetota bacterium]